jgi:hypothetical protein
MTKKIILLLLPIFFSLPVFTQDASALEFLNSLQEGGAISDDDDDNNKSGGYKSFVQNEYDGIVKQLKQLQLDEKKEIYFSDLAEQRIELATQLCGKTKEHF